VISFRRRKEIKRIPMGDGPQEVIVGNVPKSVVKAFRAS